MRECTVEGIVNKLSNLESIGDHLLQFSIGSLQLSLVVNLRNLLVNR